MTYVPHTLGMTNAATLSASFRTQTNKRKFSAPFCEDGAWWILDAAGHQWCLVEGDWVQFTDDDDEFARALRRKVA